MGGDGETCGCVGGMERGETGRRVGVKWEGTGETERRVGV